MLIKINKLLTQRKKKKKKEKMREQTREIKEVFRITDAI